MPTDALPPADVATNLPALVYWVMAGLVAVSVAFWMNSQKVRDRYEDLLREQKDDAKDTATKIAEFKAVLSQVLANGQEILAELRGRT